MAPSLFPPYFCGIYTRLVCTPLPHVLLQVDQLEYVQSTKMQRSLLKFKTWFCQIESIDPHLDNSFHCNYLYLNHNKFHHNLQQLWSVLFLLHLHMIYCTKTNLSIDSWLKENLMQWYISMNTYSTSQSVPTILVLKTRVGLCSWKKIKHPAFWKKQGAKNQGHCYAKREEAAWYLLF